MQNNNHCTTSEQSLPATSADKPAPGILSRVLYATGYYLSYGVTLPTVLVVGALPLDNALGQGLHDGAVAATGASHRAHDRIAIATSSAGRKVSDAYAGVAQKVQEKVEAVQDGIAARKHRRRIAGA